MKHFILLFFATTLLCQGQIIDFPDPNFKTALLNRNPVIDTNGDGEIQIDEAEAVSGWLKLSDKNISDLTGIEYFINVNSFDCSHNNLTQVDFSSNSFSTLIIAYNNLTELDLSNQEQLSQLYCSFNMLSDINLSGPYMSFYTIDCSNNQLMNIDVSNVTLLSYFKCENNLLTNLNLGSSGNIRNLLASNNQISSLILPAESYLAELDVHNNLLTSLDLSNNQSYQYTTIINCSNNQLTQLKLSVEDNTLELDCSNNQLTELTIMSNSDSRFQLVKCSGNLFANLDFSDSNVIVLDSGNNPLLETINWRNGWNYKVDPDNPDNGFENLPNLSSVCIDSYNQELMDFILAEVGHSVDFYNNETCDALSVNENNLNVLSITPNPAENNIKIEASTPINQVDVFNQLGQLVLSKSLNTGIAKTTLDISALGQGLYFVKISGVGGDSIIKKIIKK